MSTSLQMFDGAELQALRRELRKRHKAGRLEARCTYYDYYDSCHAPVEKPDAPWVPVETSDWSWERNLKSGGGCLYLISAGVYRLATNYSTYEVRIKASV